MATKIFVNLPVKNLQKTNDFFTRLGFSFNAQFSDDKATCMIINEDAYAMLLTEEFFRGFTSKPLADAHQSTEVLVALSAESRAGVDDMVNKALAAGGSEAREPKDHDFMYIRCFNDPDGHMWEVFWMDPAAVNPQ